jgi:hypothetical protein
MGHRALLLVALLPGGRAAAQPSPRTSVARTLVHVAQRQHDPVVTTVSVSLRVVATLTNRTRDTLWVYPHLQHPPYPPQVDLQRWDGRQWRHMWASGKDWGGLPNPPHLAPGASRIDTLRVWGSRRINVAPAFGGLVAGTYRLRYRAVYRTWSTHPLGGELVADSLLTSNAFQIRPAL